MVASEWQHCLKETGLNDVKEDGSPRETNEKCHITNWKTLTIIKERELII